MRVVLVSRSEPLEQMTAYIVERGVDVEIVGEAEDIPESGQIVAQEHPEWLFLLADSASDMVGQLQEVRAGHTGLNIAAFHEGGKTVQIIYGAKPGQDKTLHAEEWEQMSTSDFVAELTAAPAIEGETPRLTDKDEHRA